VVTLTGSVNTYAKKAEARLVAKMLLVKTVFETSKWFATLRTKEQTLKL
jgi:hypothetical protein